jgi:glycosyltransferase involved in cell wall biosynthesis
MNLSIAAVGDTTDPRCWSGIPFHFWHAARAAGFAATPWRVDLEKVRLARLLWNAGRVLSGRNRGGFQYSNRFLDAIEAQIPEALWQGEILTFNQHFPWAVNVDARGGRLSHYLDAPFAALATGRGLDLKLPRGVVDKALALERENYSTSDRVITMARWAAEVAVAECGVPAEKCHVILPGANLDLPTDWSFPHREGRPGKERAFTLGFVGKDWKRKGLPLLLAVQKELSRRGWKVLVLAAGVAPAELLREPGLEFAGYLDKQKDPNGFLTLLARCDLGCLFSEREALGISTLEFLRSGVPVAGFAHEGMADTIPPDAGFRFTLGDSAERIADDFDDYLHNEMRQDRFRDGARRWSEYVTWERCVMEFHELWATGKVANPVQPWKGLPL